MSTLFISEYSDVQYDRNGTPVMVGKEPSAAEQNVAIGGASLQSAGFSATTRFVMIHTDAICCYAVGANPTAVITAKRMAANESRFIGVNPGDKIAVIAST